MVKKIQVGVDQRVHLARRKEIKANSKKQRKINKRKQIIHLLRKKNNS